MIIKIYTINNASFIEYPWIEFIGYRLHAKRQVTERMDSNWHYLFWKRYKGNKFDFKYGSALFIFFFSKRLILITMRISNIGMSFSESTKWSITQIG